MAALNRPKFTEPDALKAISPARLRALLHPWAAYLEGRGLQFPTSDFRPVNYDMLSRILMTPSPDVPKAMIEALYYIHETATNDDMDALLESAAARHLHLERDLMTTPADVAVQAWLAAPDIVRERHAESIALRQQNFLYYSGTRGTARPFPAVDNQLREDIEAALGAWFADHNRGRGCRIFFFPQLPHVWILVRHGMPMRREPSHQDDGGSKIEFYRPQQHDVLIYDTDHDEIAVHANTKGEIKLYLSCLGRMLFGDEGYFPKDDKYNLSPLIERGPDCLLCEDVAGLEAIRLVEFRRFWGGPHKEIEIRRATDIFAALGSRGQVLGTAGRLSSASFKVRFSGSAKERSVIIRPPGNARYERNEDSELIEKWLTNRGFVTRSKAQIDDETPSEVLEDTGPHPAGNDGSTGMAPQAG